MKRLSVKIVTIVSLLPSVFGCGGGALHPWEKGLNSIKEKNSYEYVTTLAGDEFRGRQAGTPESVAASELIARWFEEIGVEPLLEEGYFQTFVPLESDNLTRFHTKLFAELTPEQRRMVSGLLSTQLRGIIEARNVLAKLEGENPNEYVIVGAHYDHIGVDRRAKNRADSIFNGADDNASGVGGVLQIARAFVASGEKPQRTIIFALWDAEETGLTGSGYFTQTFAHMDQVKSYLNFDMIGRDERAPGKVLFTSNDSRALESMASADAAAYRLEVEAVTDLDVFMNRDKPSQQKSDKSVAALGGGSDHQSFHIAGVPVYFMTAGDHPDVHRPSDEAHKIDYPKMTDIAKLAYLAVYRLANPEVEIVYPNSKIVGIE